MEVRGRDPLTGEALSVTVEEGRIAAVEPAGGVPGHYLSAGLVDLQVNGYLGRDLNGGAVTPEDVQALCRHMAARGVTTFLPTLITAAEETLVQAMRAIATARAEDPLAARMIPGIHVEGPAISPEDGPRGAHPAAHVRPPDLREFERWQEASGGLVSLVTLCPAHDGALGFISALARAGVHVSVGHSSAAPAQIMAAVRAGARLSTHLGNGAPATMPRHPNPIWTQLDLDDLTAMLIVDGHHLPPEVVRVMLRAKGRERSILVSDVVALGGMPPGVYESPIGGAVEVSASGRVGMAGTGFLAGAGLTLEACVAICAGMLATTPGHVLPLATRNPGRFVGGRGRLDVGAPADLFLYDWQPGDTALSVMEVYVGGEQVAPC
ncbi:amidohydrolase family protein [Rhodobacterales bacterium HKCCE2091]|nr:amidohydrolase family protein [Rhodobacterales bacterium HKCCE2091]